MTTAAAERTETEPQRIASVLLRDVRAVAPALGETPRQYLERIVREALERDLPRAAEELAQRSTNRKG